tara:strand:+ start:75 stop:1007 length:933 start_codon:yes stop_codon:yes gene_type:complete
MINSNYKSILIAASLLFNFAHKIKNFSKLASLINPNFAYVSKVGISTAALMGGYDSVSGASTEITSPSIANGKVGDDFVYRITTAPRSARNFSASPLPSGLRMGTGNLKSYILGKPLNAGETDVLLSASKPGYGSVVKEIKIRIEAAGLPPVLKYNQPLSKVVYEKSNVLFSVDVVNSESASFRWYFNNKLIVGQTSTKLLLSNVSENQSGSYFVSVSNEYGTTKSSDFSLTVKLNAPTPKFSSIEKLDDKLYFKFFSTRGRTYIIQQSIYSNGGWENLYLVEGNGEEIVNSVDFGKNNRMFFRILLKGI